MVKEGRGLFTFRFWQQTDGWGKAVVLSPLCFGYKSRREGRPRSSDLSVVATNREVKEGRAPFTRRFFPQTEKRRKAALLSSSCLSSCLSVYLCICLSVCLSIYLAIYIYLSTYLPIYLSTYLSTYLPGIYLYLYILPPTSTSTSTCTSIYSAPAKLTRDFFALAGLGSEVHENFAASKVNHPE